jgi:hypothetical protein
MRLPKVPAQSDLNAHRNRSIWRTIARGASYILFAHLPTDVAFFLLISEQLSVVSAGYTWLAAR